MFSVNIHTVQSFALVYIINYVTSIQVYSALSPQTSPGVACVFQVLGKDEVLDRLRKTITATSHHNP